MYKNFLVYKKYKKVFIFTDAAKVQFKGNNSSDQCIKDAIQSWLKLAKSRHMYNTTTKKN